DNGTPQNPADDFWLEEEKLAASDAKPGDRFGWAVATHGRWAAVGAIAGQDYGAQRNGNVYIFGAGPDCNENRDSDVCDLIFGHSDDADANGIPDECEFLAAVPTATTWGLIVMALIGCAAGTIVFRGHPLRAIVGDRDRV
ncbi:MAG: FG-GAP repeat protein, partial [Phycisphaerales bacterium]